MNVVLLAGAGSIHTIRWTNALADAGLKVTLLTKHDLIEPVRDDVRVEVLRAPGLWGYLAMVPRARRIIRAIGPDLVNAHYAAGYGTTARLLGVRPWLLSVWGRDVYEVPDSSPIHRHVVCTNLRAADRVASTSHAMRRRLKELVPHLGEVEITPFGVDTEAFRAASAERRLGSGDSLVIGTVKALHRKYGVDTLIRAFAVLRERLRGASDAPPALRLRIVGDGPERAALMALARELRIASIVEFVGRVPHPQVPEALASLDIYVALSRLDSESFGVAVIEASASGRPVVVSDVGGLPEVVEHGNTGFVVPRNDPGAAADALEQLVRQPALRQRLGEAGRRHVQRHYEWSACVAKMLHAYEQTIASARR